MTYESQAVRDARIDVAALFGAVLRRLPRILLVTLALLALAFIFLLFQPRLYESSSSILVEPRSNIYTRAANEQAPTISGNDAGVVSSQIELIKSRDTLLKVIDQLDLRSVPEFNRGDGGGFAPMSIVTRLLGRAATPVSVDENVLDSLYDRLNVVQERDSRIISIRVRSTDPELAARIANAIANAHVNRRTELSLSDTAEASGWLRDEIAKLRVSVTEAETAVANFKVENDLFIGSNNTSLADQQVSTIASQITAAQERKNSAESRAALIRSMIDKGQAIDGMAGVTNSTVIQQLSQEKGRLQGEKAQRSATLLSNHPTIQALNAQIAELDNQINIEGRRVAAALDAEAQVEANLEESLRADLTRAKSSSSTVTQDTVTLDALEREAKAQRDLLESYLLRYSEAASRTDSNSALPDVRVVTVAAPSVTPASPQVQLVLIAVGVVALATQIGLVVFGELMSGRALLPARDEERPQDELEQVPFVAEEAAEEAMWAYEARQEADVAVVQPEQPVVVNVAAGDAVEDETVAEGLDPEDAAWLARPATIGAAAPVVAARPVAGLLKFSDLASDLVLGRTHLVMLAAHGSNDAAAALAEELVADAISRGLSVALVDAGSGRPSTDAGLTDLSAGSASFGDVVNKSADNSFAEVYWGTGRAIARSSSKPMTLVEALGDIYEVVVLMTGPVGISSSLPFFEGLEGRLVLVAGPEDDLDAVAGTRQLLASAGFERCDVMALPTRAAA
ncbi:MAG TPA: GumC family protein [Devosia sp.]|uniref:GumC family protein n=1 Tax=Devosia sp. TaxID=1871048 RepID=UPI002F956D19